MGLLQYLSIWKIKKFYTWQKIKSSVLMWYHFLPQYIQHSTQHYSLCVREDSKVEPLNQLML